MRSRRLQLWHPVDDIDCKGEAICLIVDRELQRGVYVALFLIATDVHVVMVAATIRELVNQRRVAVEVEYYRFVHGEETVKVAIR